jgi:carboxypeptidase T
MTVIVRVSPTGPLSLSQLVRMPLGLDVWEIQPDSVVLRATESVLVRLERMGYAVA